MGQKLPHQKCQTGHKRYIFEEYLPHDVELEKVEKEFLTEEFMSKADLSEIFGILPGERGGRRVYCDVL